MVGEQAVAAAKEVRSRTAPTAMAMPKMSPPATRAMPTTTANPTTTAKTRSSQRKYLLLVGGAAIVLLLVIVVVVGERLATPEGRSSRKSPTSAHQRQTAETALVNSGGPPAAAEPDAKISRSTSTPAKNESQAPLQRIRLSPDDAAGFLVEKVVPDYPPLAQQAHVKGSVVLDADISKDGAIEKLKLVTGHPLLAPAAIDAVKHWRYKPYVLNGQAVPVNTQITVNFSLTGG